MKFDGTDYYAALMHEVKNNLGMLSMTLESLPAQGEPSHDDPIAAARRLCQEVGESLQQALLIYKADHRLLSTRIEAYSPHDLLDAIGKRAESLAQGRYTIDVVLTSEVPAIWFLDRDLVEMALISAVQNSLDHTRSFIRIEADRVDDFLMLRVVDDSSGYPAHILASVAAKTPYRASGTGLGLQFSRLIAETHANAGRLGELRLHNDNGAVFCLCLP